MHWNGVRLCGPTRAVVSPATQRVVAAGWLGMSKATQATREGVTDLNFVIEPDLCTFFSQPRALKKGAVCQVPTVFLNCSASKNYVFILSNIQNRFKAGLNHPVESTINQIQQTRNIETRWEGGEAIRWRVVPISPVQR